jgi:hypothetical protein
MVAVHHLITLADSLGGSDCRRIEREPASTRRKRMCVMKHLRVLSVTVFAVLIVGCSLAASAFAATEVVNLPGEANATIKGENLTATTELQNAAGSLKGTGVKFEANMTGPAAGEYSSHFFKVKNNKGEECKTTGALAEEVVTPLNTFKVVNDVSAGVGVAALLNVKVPVICGTLTIKVETTNLVALLLGGEVEKETGFSAELRCSATVGEPKETKYWEAGVEKVALLLANFGTGFKKACEDIQPNLTLAPSHMIMLKA